MKIFVIGPGRWGSFIAWYLNKIGHTVTLYGKENTPQITEIINTRHNEFVHFEEAITVKTKLDGINDNDYIIISIPSQNVIGLMNELKPYQLKNKKFILCMKGIDNSSYQRLSEIVTENIDLSNKVAVWIGPGHVQEFSRGIPNCMVIDSLDHDTKKELIEQFSSDLIRFYYGNDLIGNEIGAAAKNVVGIAAGMLDGLNLSTLKGALMSRGTREIARLIKAMGGNDLSAYGLCHLGDYEATVFSKFSHNRAFGELFVRGEKFEKLAEGYYTVKALIHFSEQYNVDLPICRAVYNMLYCNADPMAEIKNLFNRSLTTEF